MAKATEFMSRDPLFKLSEAGLYCPRGAFHVDPWAPVASAVITHAHGDHACKGSRRYLTAEPGRRVLWSRMGQHARIEATPYGDSIDLNEVKVSFHPAGHILGSAQIRAEYQGEVWVISGDYKVAADVTCTPFEPVRCHTFVTESTFAQPCFHWEPQAVTMGQIHDWWRENQAKDHASFLYAYSLGKAQRLLAGLDPSVGPIFVHRDIEAMNEVYRETGIGLPSARVPNAGMTPAEWKRAMILLPPSARWQQGFAHLGHFTTAFASGWMTLPDAAHERRVHSGFAISDHADYQELLNAVSATGAERIFVTHGYIDEFVSDLKSRGYAAEPLRTPRCRRPPRVKPASAVNQQSLPFS